MTNIGFVGLGVMGRPMAGHLIAAGHKLFLRSRSAAPNDLIEKGGVACANGPPIAPPIGGRRSDLRPRSVAACIPQHWRALPAPANPDLLPIAHQNDHARIAWLQADATTIRSCPTKSP
jgi:hypothetical protein